jgi:hypothetical protein
MFCRNYPGISLLLYTISKTWVVENIDSPVNMQVRPKMAGSTYIWNIK